MGKPAPRTAQANKRRRFAEKARAELNRRGFADTDIGMRRKPTKRALKSKKDA